MHGQFRRHSSHPSGAEFAKPAMVKIIRAGAATALPVMLYHQWIQVHDAQQSDAPDETKGSDDEKSSDWIPAKLACEDASLHISR